MDISIICKSFLCCFLHSAYTEKGSEWQLYNPERRDVTTNARKPGAHVYRIDGDEILEPTEGRPDIKCVFGTEECIAVVLCVQV